MRDLKEEEKRYVREAMNSPFWPIFSEFLKDKITVWNEEAESALSSDITSILEREQLFGAGKHCKYLIADFENYVKTQNQAQ